ncbi:Bug family tripartite tricarboxylate transporter substrate binding protein [Pseudoroseomonas ludipueritiae]|uniref:Tripartite tricarboxylate transporter substrate binding protein n=1 Tax=Pseudoroseomonas ludipueritiae TaxID=198093 RepID=A0ABR7R611_9PROT|nr:tripartite tricarboxylate transporter substrate binding protein [Pseudoroseomonas ludipueritiae]MBC9177166.1 tripartite tricarboxylate transporter substrate binding protein [Pseudoroseomonas ludipueritiae]
MTTVSRRGFATLVAGLLPLPLAAQEAYPARPVRLVVSYGAGGAVDTVARLVFARVAEGLGQPVVVENRAGAGGTIGANAVAQSKPDGYTLLDDASGFAINPALMPRLPYDARRDFLPVARIVTVPNVLLLGPACPATTVPELIALAKAKPGEITCASTGTGSSQHLALELFNRTAGTEIIHVPYRDTPAAQNDLRAGRIGMIVSTATSAIPLHRQEGLRVIAHTGQGAVARLPGVPAVAQTLPGYESLEWHGLFAPAGTPPAIAARLATALDEALKDPGLRERLAMLGASPGLLAADAFRSFVGEEIEKWGRLIQAAGIQAG